VITRIVLIALVAFVPRSAVAQSLIITVGDQYPPYVDRDLDRGGYALARIGKSDMTFPWIITEERTVEFVISAPIFSVDYLSWTRAGADQIQTQSDMAGKSVCLPEDYSFPRVAEEAFDAGTLERHSPGTMKQCFLMLDGGRVDFVLSASGEAIEAITLAGLSHQDFETAAEPLETIDSGILISRQNPHAEDIAQRLSDAFVTLIANGSIEALQANYDGL